MKCERMEALWEAGTVIRAGSNETGPGSGRRKVQGSHRGSGLSHLLGVWSVVSLELSSVLF